LYDSIGPLKIHSKPIPRLGGVAITLAFAAGTSFSGHLSQMHVWPFFAALILIWAAGLIDDIRGLSPTLRLAAQVGGAILLWSGDWRLPWLAGPVNLAASCVLMVVFINSFNFLDGSDGLCAGVTGIIAAAFLVFPGFTLSSLGTTVAWSLLGVCFGFLVFNFPPAGIFMGDSGSTVLGFGIAFLAFDFYRMTSLGEHRLTLAFPLLTAALPLLDGILTVLRRFIVGVELVASKCSSDNLWTDRGHVHRCVACSSMRFHTRLFAVRRRYRCVSVRRSAARISSNERKVTPSLRSAQHGRWRQEFAKYS
jgi:UDP-GlcNAc:undecaprenyl-phosphate GlcNAc-1-phosphate transferase